MSVPNDFYLGHRYIKKNPSYHVHDSFWKAEKIHKIMLQNRIRPSSILEVGCGAGEVLSNLQTMMPKVSRFVGYDISPDAIKIAKKHESDRLKFHCDDFLEINSEKFDVLLCIDVFEHVEDYLGFLRKLKTKTSIKIFHIPLEYNVYSLILKKHMISYEKLGHLHYFSKNTAIRSLEHAGYTIIDWFYTAGSLRRGRKGLGVKMLKMPRRLLFYFDSDLTVRILGGFSLLVLTK